MKTSTSKRKISIDNPALTFIQGSLNTSSVAFLKVSCEKAFTPRNLSYSSQKSIRMTQAHTEFTNQRACHGNNFDMCSVLLYMNTVWVKDFFQTYYIISLFSNITILIQYFIFTSRCRPLFLNKGN